MMSRPKRKAALKRATASSPLTILGIAKPLTMKVRCSREELHAALRRRYFLSSRPIVTCTFLLLVAAVTVFLSRTVWAEYDPWNIPSLISGLVSAGLSWPVFVWLQELLKSARGKPRLRTAQGILHVTIRRGHASVAFLILALLFTGVFLAMQTRDLLREVHEMIGIGGPGRLDAAKTLYEGKIANGPRYLGDNGAVCLGAVLEALDVDKQNTPSNEWDNIARRASLAREDARGFVRDWSAYVIALADVNDGRVSKAVAELTLLADAEQTDRTIRYRSYERLGYIAHTSQMLEDAKQHYLNAVQFGATSALCENLGGIFQDQKLFDLAEPFYERSKHLLENERAGKPHPRAHVHHMNLASFYNNYSEGLLARSKDTGLTPVERTALLDKYKVRLALAEDHIQKAFSLNQKDLEIYWVAASIEYNANRAAGAITWLDQAQEFLNRRDKAAAAALAGNHYATIGPFYNAWLRVRILYELTPLSPALLPAINELKTQVAGFSNAPVDRLRQKLIDVQATGFSGQGDLPSLEKMKVSGLFDSYSTPLWPDGRSEASPAKP